MNPLTYFDPVQCAATLRDHIAWREEWRAQYQPGFSDYLVRTAVRPQWRKEFGDYSIKGKPWPCGICGCGAGCHVINQPRQCWVCLACPGYASSCSVCGGWSPTANKTRICRLCRTYMKHQEKTEWTRRIQYRKNLMGYRQGAKSLREVKRLLKNRAPSRSRAAASAPAQTSRSS